MQPGAPEAPSEGGKTRRPPPDDLMPERCLGRRLKEVRDRRGLSQARLAEVVEQATGLKLDPTAITRIERGDRAVRLNEAVALSVVLGLSLDELIAPHPGNLDDQVERAGVDLRNAEYAAEFWRAEVDARRLYYEQARRQWETWREEHEQRLGQHWEALRQQEERGDLDLDLDRMDPDELYATARYLVAEWEGHVALGGDCCGGEQANIAGALRQRLARRLKRQQDEQAASTSQDRPMGTEDT